MALILGIAAGYLAGLFDKPATSNETIQRAAGAGAIAGVGALLGQMAGGALNGVVFDPQMYEAVYESLGVYNAFDSNTFMIYSIIIGCCLGIIVLILMALFGALGGFIWFRTSDQKDVDTPGLV